MHQPVYIYIQKGSSHRRSERERKRTRRTRAQVATHLTLPLSPHTYTYTHTHMWLLPAPVRASTTEVSPSQGETTTREEGGRGSYTGNRKSLDKPGFIRARMIGQADALSLSPELPAFEPTCVGIRVDRLLLLLPGISARVYGRASRR